VNKTDYLSKKFGGIEKLKQINDRLRDMAATSGVGLNPDVPQRIPNTLDAHRLIHWAGLEGLQTLVVAAIFRAYWTEGRDIGEHSVLADVAAACGMDRAVTLRLLQSDADRDDIQARDADARAKGVSAVPTFLIAQQYAVSGAQPAEVWDQILNDLIEATKAS
jgi:predicted DsbA family dithiol-disulfide isomerase